MPRGGPIASAIEGDLGGHVLPTRTHKTAPPVLPASVPSPSNPPINMAIEPANGHPIKEELFNSTGQDDMKQRFRMTFCSSSYKVIALLGAN